MIQITQIENGYIVTVVSPTGEQKATYCETMAGVVKLIQKVFMTVE